MNPSRMIGLSFVIVGWGAAAHAEVPGQDLYLVNCRLCHGTNGTAGMPLAGNASLEDGAYVARTIIEGRGYMTPFGEHLTDEEIAAVATFVRTEWGNDFGAVDAAVVASAR